MSDLTTAIVGIGGTLAGAAVMGAFNLWSQHAASRERATSSQRADRRDVYARFLSAALEVLFRRAVISSPQGIKKVMAILAAEPVATIRDRQRRVEEAVVELGDVTVEVQLVASPAVVVAAETISICVRRVLMNPNVDEDTIEAAAKELRGLRNRFLRAARAEIGTEPVGWPSDDRAPLNP